jgi:hypothetical protein
MYMTVWCGGLCFEFLQVIAKKILQVDAEFIYWSPDLSSIAPNQYMGIKVNVSISLWLFGSASH